MASLRDRSIWCSIGELIIDRMVWLAHAILVELQAIPDWPAERSGGYLAIARKDSGQIIAISLIGECPNEERARAYLGFCQEKLRRLVSQVGHVSSFQSKHEEAGKYAGAIIAGDYALSFSGLPQLADEALVIRLAKQCRLIDVATADLICKISGNDFLVKLG